ncbi:MAG: chemotaxis response regulator protein-glutamate methylesterase [Polyangiaceae bacterium]|nr:chemotaxis response regulator protein-glutamate methylesterase [Polyangiaceae bacterium]
MIRVLIVDDSMFMRGAIKKVLTASGTFEVVGQAGDGNDAVKKAVELAPDVISMDFNMPGMSGADAVQAIMERRPTPIVMFSAHTTKGAKETLDALSAGAVDFVTKPAGEVSADLSKVQDELIRKLSQAAGSKPKKAPVMPARAVQSPPSSGQPAVGMRGGMGSPTGSIPRPPASSPGMGMNIPMPPASSPGFSPQRTPVPSVRSGAMAAGLPKLCVIAVSTGGPVALGQLVPQLPADTRFAVVIVQHMPAHFTAALAERLNSISQVAVQEAARGDRPRPGVVLIAPGDKHLEFDDRGAVVLKDGPLVNGCKPAADVTMASAAKVYGRRTIGVVLTGMGRDGTAGIVAIRRAEGRTLAQDEESSVIFGMPKSAIESGAIEEVAPLGEIAARLRYL